jgi:hypothetical protein
MILLTKPELRHELVSARNKLKKSEASNLKLLIAVAETANYLEDSVYIGVYDEDTIEEIENLRKLVKECQ